MSRVLRKQMLTMIDLLDKANKALKISLTANRMNESGIRQLLSDCQETAATMGNELEMIYGEGTNLVHTLEEYHESLYQMTQVLKHPGKRYELWKELSSQIRQARKFLDEQIPDKLEVVFLPYKVSLWESMESTWRASENDEDCDVYVVPVPYYDRGPDGSFTRYHYEGEEMPSYVPVTHYENYDLQKRWPDTVFIQDPYDHTHSGISVDPRFYSHEIKKIAGTLVYISYLYSGKSAESVHDTLDDEQQNADQQDTSEEKHRLCTAPGVLNADMVIVHSKEEKQFYLDAIAAELGEGMRVFWNDKIFYMDAPKTENEETTGDTDQGSSEDPGEI